MSSIFNSEGWKKAVGTYKNNQAAPKTVMPTGAISALNNRPTPPQPGLPPAAFKAASNVRSGIPTAPTVPPAATAAAQRMVSATSTQPRTEQALTAQSNLVNTPFTFNPESDPSYQAALRAAQQNLQVNQKNTNAQLRATGQGKSSYSETVANQLANQSTENIANNILPVYAQQAYQQYQDNIGNQRNLYQDQYQQDYTTPLNVSSQTGTYLPPEAKAALETLTGLKTQAESAGINAADRKMLSSEADKVRAQLKALGIDISGLGADRSAAQVSSTPVGVRTLAGQAQDQSAKNANLDAATAVSNMTGKVITPQTDWQGLVRQAANPNTPLNANQQNTQFNQQYQLEQFAYSKARDAISDKQWQTKFDEDVRQNGLSYGLQQLSQQNDQAYRQAQLGLSQDDNARQWVALDYDQSQPAADKYTGMTASQLLDNIKPLYQEPVYTVDKLGKQVDTGKTQLTKDPTKLTDLFETVVDAGLSDTETKQVLLSLGYTMKDIESRIKQYSGN